ncbi:MAG: protein-export chaperone SecB [Candidatus Adiutrix sp.]|jgi:preprotein translocase subunit SecB|nr:protein-export chaperone SecB [Candidatus Adiutrix sp.]
MMAKNQPRIEMAQLRLLKSVFMANLDYQHESLVSLGVSLKNNGEFSDDDSRAYFRQSFVTLGASSAPFLLEVEFWALFLIDPPIMPLERRHYVRHVFPRLVFPYMREYVAETTRRGGFTPLVLNPEIFEDTRAEPEAPPVPEGGNKWIH